MSRLLNDLSPRFRNPVFEFLGRSTEAGVPLLIVDTIRTAEQQAQNIINKVSWTTNSKHLPQLPDGLSLAIDVVPYEIYTSAPGGDKLAWDPKHPAWLKIGVIGERLGFTWGGRWKHTPDFSHFEWKAIQPSGPTKDGFTA